VKQIEAAQLLDVEMIGEIAPQLGCGEEVKAQDHMTAVAEFDLAPVSAIIVLETTHFSMESTRIVGVLPTERTIVIKVPEVTRAISVVFALWDRL
jgi:hypothetical protein